MILHEIGEQYFQWGWILLCIIALFFSFLIDKKYAPAISIFFYSNRIIFLYYKYFG